MKKVPLSLLLTLSLTGCTRDHQASKTAPTPPSWNEKISKFSNCQEIESYLENFNPGRPGEASAPVSSDSSGPRSFQPQVEGVEEGDLLQTSEKFYFFSRPGSVEIIDRSKLSSVKSIPVPSMPFHWALSADLKLVSISGNESETWVRVFDELKNFQMASETRLSGKPIDFRYSGESLVLVTSSNFMGIPSSVDCSQIFRPDVEDGSTGLTLVHRLPIQSPAGLTETLALWGSSEFFYMTKTELFLFQKLYSEETRSSFRVIDWSSEKLSFKQINSVEGSIKDRTAIHQQNSHLIIASTTTSPESRLFANRLETFKKDKDGIYLRHTRTQPFGETEDIRAVRFTGDKAYVVTFEKTDPLFVFDIGNPEEIKLLSELKVPGFSTQLHVLNKESLFGIGFDAIADNGFSWYAGIKASIFDIRNPLSPLEKSTLMFGGRGSYSEAVFDSRGLSVFNEGKNIGLPLVEVTEDSNSSSALWEEPGAAMKHVFSGAVILEIQDLQVVEKARVTHKVWRERLCGEASFTPLYWWESYTPSLDIQRLMVNKDCIDTFSRFGVMRFCSSTEKPSASLEFKNEIALCGLKNSALEGPL